MNGLVMSKFSCNFRERRAGYRVEGEIA